MTAVTSAPETVPPPVGPDPDASPASPAAEGPEVGPGEGQRGRSAELAEPGQPSPAGPLLDIANLWKTYRLGRVRVEVLHGVRLAAAPGECVCILGQSGSGKSTLLHLIGGLDRPDPAKKTDRVCGACGCGLAGGSPDGPCPACGSAATARPRPKPSIRFAGQEITRFGARRLDRYRSRDVGFVFQFYHLLPELTVFENVAIGGMIRGGLLGYGAIRGETRERAVELLTRFGLGHRLRHRPAQLSGGERQRVAIARALVNRPRLLLADEPTGNLDQRTGGQILDALFEARAALGLTTLMVTHDVGVAERADRVVRLVDGRVGSGAEAEAAP